MVRVLLGVHYSNAEVFRGSILWILGVLPSILDVCTAGTACTRRYVLLILPVLALFRPSVLLILRHSILLILQVLAVFAPSVLLILQVLAVFGPSILLILPSTRSIWAVNTAHTPKYSQYLGRQYCSCLLYTSPSPRDLSTSRMPSSA